jgi:hypothetical protein
MGTADMPPTIIAFKGFNRDLTCREFQYAIGATYTHEGSVAACEAGFHACEYPLDVFKYYPPGTSRYAEVEQAGEIARDGSDSKIASARLTVTVEISLHEMITRAVKWVFDRAKPEDTEHATGDRGAASSTGDQGAASSTGYRGAASSTGDQGAASSTGYRGAASSTGDRGAASSTGCRGAAMAAGHEGRVMGADGNALFAVYRDPTTDAIMHAWAGVVGRDGIKAGVWYQVGVDGRPVEVEAV